MPKPYSGSLHVRLSPELHASVAREAFERGVSMSDLVSHALQVRALLANVDPWSTFEENRSFNASIPRAELEADIDEAVAAVRREMRTERAPASSAVKGKM